ncbi:glycosyltransferase [Paraflavisolibacter sp. H34]|uniref:glycosyltransferase n=1 Tax=Huijunlia imazamoxiresistens TaxID=3127457 RepID=UPI003017D78F
MSLMISVILSSSGNPVFLKRCLEALVKQTLDHRLFEVLVVGAGAEPDGAAGKVVELFTPTSIAVRCLPSPAGRNAGWQAAAGRLIAFTDDNCLPDEAWLQAFVQAYNGAAEAAFAGRVQVPLSIPLNEFEQYTAGQETTDLKAANCCCTRAALEKAGGFDEHFPMSWLTESDLEFKLLQQGIAPRYLPDALVLRPAYEASWRHSIREQKKGMFHAMLYRKYPEFYPLKAFAPPPGSDYARVACTLLAAAGLLSSLEWLAQGALICWLLLWTAHTLHRLSAFAPSLPYAAAVALTSALLPFASVYWYWYGKWKFRHEAALRPGRFRVQS